MLKARESPLKTKAVLQLYKKFVSPFINTLFGGGCRFTPTCSVYTRDAIRKYGIVKGGAMAAWRILRCNPWYGGNLNNPVE